MAYPFNFGASHPQIYAAPKRSVFISYHHEGDQQYYDAFTRAFDDAYDILFDNSIERRIDSDNVNYVLQRIRDSFISGSSCTIVMCGLETPWRKYVDWEIKATLDMEHGLIGVNLPTNGANASGNVTVPDRLHDNIQSGYAVWTNWSAFTGNPANVKSMIEQAVARPAKSIAASRPMMARNGTPPWKTTNY
ncbi:MAG TPA: TIR domain-containing protein [Verrucomicrobiae bacterium]|jgi:hypothetical protein